MRHRWRYCVRKVDEDFLCQDTVQIKKVITSVDINDEAKHKKGVKQIQWTNEPKKIGRITGVGSNFMTLGP